MVKRIDPILNALVLMILLAGCARSANPAELDPPVSVPAPATEPAALATTPAPAPQASDSLETVEVGGMRFVTRTIPVDSATVAAADFDADGRLDLVGAGEPQLSLFRGDGRGGLEVYARAPGGHQPNDFAFGDLDEDGDLDMVVANHDTNYLTILLGDGAGGFAPAPNSPLRVSVSPHPHVVRAADLDADGHVDLLVDHRDAGGVLVLRGLGDGQFESPGTLIDAGGDPYLGMALGDLDGDGRLDLVTPNPSEAGVFLNAGGLRFVAAAPVPATLPFAVGLGDFDGDLALDLVTAADEASPLVEVFLGDGAGGFTAPGASFRLASGGKNLVVGDFNGDGLADAAVASYHHPDVLILLGGRGGIATASLPGGRHPWGLAAADLNGDGRDDLVIADDGAGQATVYVSAGP